MTSGYYKAKLSAERLRKCYEIAGPRVRQYFSAEIEHVMKKAYAAERIVELGCGYGRVLEQLAYIHAQVMGIDHSLASLELARELLAAFSNIRLAAMDAKSLAFADDTFDVTIRIQNGISAFHVDRVALIRESVRITKPEGWVLFSSYSSNFWEHRLEWFYQQAAHGCLGEIDGEKTRDGVIVCKDGFRAETVDPKLFLELAAQACPQDSVSIIEIDGSSLFCEIKKHPSKPPKEIPYHG